MEEIETYYYPIAVNGNRVLVFMANNDSFNGAREVELTMEDIKDMKRDKRNAFLSGNDVRTFEEEVEYLDGYGWSGEKDYTEEEYY